MAYHHHHHQYHHRNIRCANCGGMGHVYRTCSMPISSYGILCFRKDPETGELQYLQIQRRDSLSYVDFLRGKYASRDYLLKLLSNMTQDERERIRCGEFDGLWQDLWQVEHGKNYQKEYADARAKFVRLQAGDMAALLAESASDLTQTEWGFPKGRRNLQEGDLGCALREFREETGIQDGHIQVIDDMQPFEELFSGLNQVRYRHVYFAALFTDPHYRVHVDPTNLTQVREVRDVQWFDYDRAQANIRDVNVERKQLLERAHADIVRRFKDAPEARAP